jgi:diadenosine tetraphosphatase ApaH/serine/threonine PP2A family protein phosphatase
MGALQESAILFKGVTISESQPEKPYSPLVEGLKKVVRSWVWRKVALFEVCRTPEVSKPNSEAIVLSKCFTDLRIHFELHSNDKHWAGEPEVGKVVNRDVIQQRLGDPEIRINVVHFALHGDPEGLVLEWNGPIGARFPYDVLKGFEIKRMGVFHGKLVVSGACASAGLAEAFVTAGATYVAPEEAVEWNDLGVFFQSFYSSLATGETAQAALALAISGHPELASYHIYSR